jgi:hypothetical protein
MPSRTSTAPIRCLRAAVEQGAGPAAAVADAVRAVIAAPAADVVPVALAVPVAGDAGGAADGVLVVLAVAAAADRVAGAIASAQSRTRKGTHSLRAFSFF